MNTRSIRNVQNEQRRSFLRILALGGAGVAATALLWPRGASPLATASAAAPWSIAASASFNGSGAGSPTGLTPNSTA